MCRVFIVQAQNIIDCKDQSEEHRTARWVQRHRHQIRLRRTGDVDPISAETVCLRLQLPARVVRRPIELKLIARRHEAQLRWRKRRGPRADFVYVGPPVAVASPGIEGAVITSLLRRVKDIAKFDDMPADRRSARRWRRRSARS